MNFGSMPQKKACLIDQKIKEESVVFKSQSNSNNNSMSEEEKNSVKKRN